MVSQFTYIDYLFRKLPKKLIAIIFCGLYSIYRKNTNTKFIQLKMVTLNLQIAHTEGTLWTKAANLKNLRCINQEPLEQFDMDV